MEPTVGPPTAADDADAGGDAIIVLRQCIELADDATAVSMLLFALCIIVEIIVSKWSAFGVLD